MDDCTGTRHCPAQVAGAISSAGVRVVAMSAEHGPAVLRIYQSGLDTGHASFQHEAPPWADWDAAQLVDHRFVALADGSVVGWAAVSPTSSRCVYEGVVELSVYVDRAAAGRGVGRALVRALLESTEEAGIWTVQSGVFPENTASLALHRSLGFRVVGRRERLGRMRDGTWRDVVLLERRTDRDVPGG